MDICLCRGTQLGAGDGGDGLIPAPGIQHPCGLLPEGCWMELGLPQHRPHLQVVGMRSRKELWWLSARAPACPVLAASAPPQHQPGLGMD